MLLAYVSQVYVLHNIVEDNVDEDNVVDTDRGKNLRHRSVLGILVGMATNAKHSVTINAPVNKVYETLQSNEFWTYAAENTSTEPGEVAEFSNDNGTDVVLFEVLPTEALPEAVRAMVSQSLKVKREIRWNALEGDNATGNVKADVKGAPVEFSAAQTLSGAGETSTIDSDISVSVNIPMMGAVIEPKVADAVKGILEKEGKLIEDFIAKN